MPYGVVLKDEHLFSVLPGQKQFSAYGPGPALQDYMRIKFFWINSFLTAPTR